ncbi:MAG: PadR family transcriptional regulator [Geminicoccaceae bacterium]
MDVRTICLGLLADKPLSGYEIRKLLSDSFRHFFLAGFGSIYPALAELSAAGLVTVVAVEQDRRPDKKVYAITEGGRIELRRTLLASEPRHKVRSEFLALLYFAHLLPPYRVSQIVDRMIQEWEHVLEDDLKAVETRCTSEGPDALTPGMRFALGFGQTMLSTALDYARQHKGELLRGLGDEAALTRAAE